MATRATNGWSSMTAEMKRDLIDAIISGRPTPGPVHLELDLTDRCNVDCYFCSQMDVRTKAEFPYPRIVAIVEEMRVKGLRSIRLAGGGDPLFHREIGRVIDYLGHAGLVIDNITTNAVGLSREIGRKLVDFACREVLVSLNAVDAQDYKRMMQVKPALFDKVVENVRALRALRDERGAESPGIVVQFLLDQENYSRLPEMYELGITMGADVIAINVVLPIALQRIPPEKLLSPLDADKLEPYVREILALDRDRRLVQICFPFDEWNAMLRRLQDEVGYEVSAGFETAPSFKEENGQCFFGWYTGVIRGGGELYPCCLLLNPEYTPLGSVAEGSFAEKWEGSTFGRVRAEMRDVFMGSGQIEYSPDRFKTLTRECVEPYKCWLKTLYFRGDEEFYRELGEALAKARQKGGTRAAARDLKRRFVRVVDRHPSLRSTWDRVRNRTRPLRIWVARKTGLPVTEAF